MIRAKWDHFLFLLISLFIGCVNPDKVEDPSPPPESEIRDWANEAKNNTTLSHDARLALLDKAYQANASLKDKDEKTKNLSRISLAYEAINDTLNFKKTNSELLALAQETGDRISLGEAHWDLGVFFRKTQADSSYYHYKQAYDLFEKSELGDKKDYPGLVKLAMANLRESNKDYAGAEKDIISVIEEFKKEGSSKRLYQAYSALATVNNGMNKFDKAIEYYLKAKEYLKYRPISSQKSKQLQLQNNIASTYLRKGDYGKAFELYTSLEKDAKKLGDSDLLVRKVYASKAISGFRSGALSSTEAQNIIAKSNKGLIALNDEFNLVRNKQYLAEILKEDNKINEAVKMALKAKDVAKTTGNTDRYLQILKFLTKTDVDNSAEHAKAFFDLTEKLQLQERSIQDKFARIQLETDEKEVQNAKLSKQRELLLGISIGLLLLGIGVVTIISQRVTNEKLRFERSQQESNQEIYNLMLAQKGKVEEGKKSEQRRISEELHDGILGQMLGIRLILSGLNERSDEEAINQREDLIKKLQELEEEIRLISHELSNESYKKVDNFILALNDLFQSSENTGKIKITPKFDESIDWYEYGGEVKINLYRIIQELIQNCIKHANCENIFVHLQKTDLHLLIKVKDDGQGYNITKSKKGIGIKNIRSRTDKLNGMVKVKSEIGKGTKVQIAIPLTVTNLIENSVKNQKLMRQT